MTHKHPHWLIAGTFGRCPSCGKSSVFSGLLGIKNTCPTCNFDLKNHDIGDGGIYFAMLIMLFVVSGLAVWVEMQYQPPIWLHAVVWTPVATLGCIAFLRLFKGLLIALKFKVKI